MNILPKKSWHVRNKNNIERVRKDEEKAAAEESERQRRIALAESEARTDLLRDRTKKRRLDDKPNQDSVVQSSSKHINFFEDLEQGKKIGGKNAEYEEEKKKEKEAQEKSIGLLTYLGQGSVELNDEKPWYYKAPERAKQAPVDSSGPAKDEIDTKRKRSLDPMSTMDRYISVSKKVEEARQGRTTKKSESRSTSSSHSSSALRPQAAKTIEELRAERLKREQQERLREQQLLARRSGDTQPLKDERRDVDERSMRYNSQFNPDFVRRPKQSAHKQYSTDLL